MGLGGGIAALGAAYLGYIILQRYVGVFSYLGMNEAQIRALAQEMDSRCHILTRACNEKGCRGIYLGGATTIPLYYHYRKDSYELYPLLWSELWSTNKDLFGLTGRTTVYNRQQQTQYY